MPTEIAFKKWLMRELEQQGAFCSRVEPTIASDFGAPDLTIVYEGQVFFVECKMIASFNDRKQFAKLRHPVLQSQINWHIDCFDNKILPVIVVGCYDEKGWSAYITEFRLLVGYHTVSVDFPYRGISSIRRFIKQRSDI